MAGALKKEEEEQDEREKQENETGGGEASDVSRRTSEALICKS